MPRSLFSRAESPSPITMGALIPLALCSAAAWGQCTPAGGAWVAAFEGSAGQPACDNNVSDVTAWDPDGPGPLPERLVVAGVFNNAGGVAVNRIAQWNGIVWQGLGSGFTVSGLPSMVAPWDPDEAGPAAPELVVGGFFTAVGGVAARNVGHWNSTAWAPFGAGTQDSLGLPDVYVSTLWDPDGAGPLPKQLVIGGEFTIAGGQSRRRIARWDGTTWQAFGTGMNDAVYCLTTWDADGDGPASPRVVAGGVFGTAGGTVTNRIAMWDGTTWQPLGAGLDGGVEAVASWDPDGAGPAAPILVAGGSFLTSGGASVKRVAQWTGSSWAPMGSGFDDNRVFTFASFDFDGSGGAPARLVAGGSFLASGTAPVNRVASWDGTLWRAMGTGMNNTVFGLTTWDPDGSGPAAPGLVAAGLFTTAGSVSAGRVALWPAALPACPADMTCDGGVDGDDVIAFFGMWDAGLAGADFNGDSGVDGDDVIAFFEHWDAGC